MNNQECVFCNVIQDKSENPVVYNTVLYESKYFQVYPALGALKEGYVLIISKRHIPSMAYLNREEQEDFSNLLSFVLNKTASLYGCFPICFEHGGTWEETNKSACCVNHAHLHIVPIRFSEEKEILSLIKAQRIKDFDDIYTYCDRPYVFFMNDRQECFISADSVVISQYMRRWIAHELGCPNQYDWRRFHFTENIESTIKKWNDQVKGETDGRFREQNR